MKNYIHVDEYQLFVKSHLEGSPTVSKYKTVSFLSLRRESFSQFKVKNIFMFSQQFLG
jgi:hypothetical protein